MLAAACGRLTAGLAKLRDPGLVEQQQTGNPPSYVMAGPIDAHSAAAVNKDS